MKYINTIKCQNDIDKLDSISMLLPGLVFQYSKALGSNEPCFLPTWESLAFRSPVHRVELNEAKGDRLPWYHRYHEYILTTASLHFDAFPDSAIPKPHVSIWMRDDCQSFLFRPKVHINGDVTCPSWFQNPKARTQWLLSTRNWTQSIHVNPSFHPFPVLAKAGTSSSSNESKQPMPVTGIIKSVLSSQVEWSAKDWRK